MTEAEHDDRVLIPLEDLIGVVGLINESVELAERHMTDCPSND